MAAAARGNKVANNYSTAMNNAMANIQAGNINYNNAAAVGMTVPQAQAYYNNLVSQQQAQNDAEREALERDIAQQEFENDLANKKFNLDYKNTMSLIDSRENNRSTKTYNLVETLEMINKLSDGVQAQNTVDALLDTGNITPETWNAIYNMNPNWQ